jgi:hypothetical protein
MLEVIAAYGGIRKWWFDSFFYSGIYQKYLQNKSLDIK